MNRTHDRLEAALNEWPVPELSAEIATRTLTRARAALDPERRPSRGALAGRLFVPVVLGAAASVIVVETCLTIRRLFDT